MTLNKVPNVDDLSSRAIAYKQRWNWAGNDGTDQGPVSYQLSTNGTNNVLEKYVELSHDGTSDENAQASYGVKHPNPVRGKVILHIIAGSAGTPSALDNAVDVGFDRNANSNARGANNTATFQFDQNRAQVTDGSGTQFTAGSLGIFKSGVNIFQFSIVVDYDDDQTEFYMDKAPLVDSPDATIAATPGADLQEPSVAMRGGPDSTELARAITGQLVMLY